MILDIVDRASDVSEERMRCFTIHIDHDGTQVTGASYSDSRCALVKTDFEIKERIRKLTTTDGRLICSLNDP